ncbi:hypothetical protein [Sphingomonas sp.]|uniref:hypothetical protein n=1 Tax=Sphingomonas sp. TaxID=28214 RepID=UPI0031D7FB80
MHFMGLLKSLDELLYEVMSWLIFYPITLWRTLTRPLQMMGYSDQELGQADERQYSDTLPPPLFLLVSLLLAHGLELVVVGDSPLIESKHGLAALVHDDTTLLIMRLVIFSVFPLMFAALMVRRRRIGLTRDTLRGPFYAQCYAVAPFALVLSIAGILIQTSWLEVQAAGLLLGAIALIVFGLVQARWFAQHLDRSLAAGFGYASIAMVESLAVVLLTSPLFT